MWESELTEADLKVPVNRDVPVKLGCNICDVCQVSMIHNKNEWCCPVCNIVKDYEDNVSDNEDSVAITIKRSVGMYKGRYYNMNVDYSKIQRKTIDALLKSYAGAYEGVPIPYDLLQETADIYNSIQKLRIEPKGGDGTGAVQKKFVRRHTIKDEILAAILYSVCSNHGCTRKRKDIAKFMQLSTGGFSKGEHIIRTLNAEGKIELAKNDDDIMSFVTRYLGSLKIKTKENKRYVERIVSLSEDKFVSMTSHISSKVAGAVWILTEKLDMKVSIKEFESACDNIKKSTFIKFVNEVRKHESLFAEVLIMPVPAPAVTAPALDQPLDVEPSSP